LLIIIKNFPVNAKKTERSRNSVYFVQLPSNPTDAKLSRYDPGVDPSVTNCDKFNINVRNFMLIGKGLCVLGVKVPMFPNKELESFINRPIDSFLDIFTQCCITK
jgi:hypothetical protein